MNFKKILSPVILAAIPALATAQFSVNSVTEALTVSEIESALSASNTDALEGVALGPGNTAFIIHDDAGALTVAQMDLTAKTALWTKTEAQILSDLGLLVTLRLLANSFTMQQIQDSYFRVTSMQFHLVMTGLYSKSILQRTLTQRVSS